MISELFLTLMITCLILLFLGWHAIQKRQRFTVFDFDCSGRHTRRSGEDLRRILRNISCVLYEIWRLDLISVFSSENLRRFHRFAFVDWEAARGQRPKTRGQMPKAKCQRPKGQGFVQKQKSIWSFVLMSYVFLQLFDDLVIMIEFFIVLLLICQRHKFFLTINGLSSVSVFWFIEFYRNNWNEYLLLFWRRLPMHRTWRKIDRMVIPWERWTQTPSSMTSPLGWEATKEICPLTIKRLSLQGISVSLYCYYFIF